MPIFRVSANDTAETLHRLRELQMPDDDREIFDFHLNQFRPETPAERKGRKARERSHRRGMVQAKIRAAMPHHRKEGMQQAFAVARQRSQDYGKVNYNIAFDVVGTCGTITVCERHLLRAVIWTPVCFADDKDDNRSPSNASFSRRRDTVPPEFTISFDLPPD
jgi:hypothetical protein